MVRDVRFKKNICGGVVGGRCLLLKKKHKILGQKVVTNKKITKKNILVYQKISTQQKMDMAKKWWGKILLKINMIVNI